VPPGEDAAMILRRFELVIFIDNDGHEQIDWRWTGEPATGMAALGYLEAAQLGMYHSHMHEHGESE
jgi:hypothetical protein